jgi:hypothetical protein
MFSLVCMFVSGFGALAVLETVAVLRLSRS